MRRPISSSGWARVLALPLALWSAVPGVQWCPVDWAEVRLECFAECSIEGPQDGLHDGSAGGAGACADAGRGCPAGVAACGLEPCETDAETADSPPGGRAYCLSGPLGGDGIPPVQHDASPPVATLPPGGWTATPDGDEERPAARIVARPPTPATGAVPRIRAPPEPGSTTC